MATYQNSRYNMALPSGSGGSLVLIKTLTASSSATLSFVDGASDVVLDNTYRTYIFKFINCRPATDNTNFTFNLSADTGSNYNVAKTSTFFNAYHKEDASDAGITYDTSRDLAQGTGFQPLSHGAGSDTDQSISGELFLFNPSNTTFVKHFIARINLSEFRNYCNTGFTGGYGNTTSAIDAVQFKYASGNISAGTIKLYGIA
jgi:hypothetical protein|tara:strand:- start:191 stop:796 length:606 start_codon:yes stop_codon:yes gene_type:complete